MFGRSLYAVFAVMVLATACGGGQDSYDSVVDKAKSEKKLVIGVKADQPGLGLRTPDGAFTGFDVEVAKYVAKQLGVEPDGITFKETVSANREAFIEQGQVDLVVATYSITDARKQKVSFAGPYFVAGQDLLVRADDSSLTGPETLNGKKLCSVAGSTPAQKVKSEYAKEVQLQEERTYSACVDRVLGGQLDAITTDNVILAGYAAQHQGKLKVVGKPFSTEKYGIGLKKDDTAGRKAVNDALEKMFADGSWTKALQASVGASGFAVPQAPQLERY
ncbi:glutamate ABC transporter substrate-binding protein [Nonomuraea sp. LP-02]|uniref:glutamate ABC transporter substrate-binding protein n=1 Tax=Nonomuraea sp. LP-02 TaxID=3097960 RepID=UPI002E3580FB|nr:glutamate ABC transporter substrate-binding protein [Nonomuraea sp. LP-02]MED7924894.1 glutamate ABC transporter substrate-binding protein [Nonomuraea sp. LP-02]